MTDSHQYDPHSHNEPRLAPEAKPRPNSSTDKVSPVLVVGLGNPGRSYRLNRHNAGFLVLDRLAEQLGIAFSRLQGKALVTDARFAGRHLILAKPQTYMNESGQAASALIRFYKIPLDQLLIVHDDLDLPPGTLRMRPGGGAGGQKGLGSIIQQLGTQEFPRLRIGIGRPPGRMDPAAYVLQNYSADELESLPGILDQSVEAILAFVEEGLQTAMNRHNREVL